MKTKSKLRLIALTAVALYAATSVYAQSQTSSQIFVRELQAKRALVNQQVTDLQDRITLMNQSIAQTQGLITERQNAIADLNTLIAATNDQNLINTYNQKIAGLNADITSNLQPLITQMQSKIAAIPAQIAAVQAEVAVIDNNISIAQQTVVKETAVAQQQSLSPANASAQPAPSYAATTPRDPNNPNNVPLFMSTGDPMQDATLVRQWLAAHPIVK